MSQKTYSPEVHDLTDVSESYPGLPEPMVGRDSEIRNIEDLLSSQGYRVVVVKGGEGYGVTTLLSQFVRENPRDCISVFLGPSRSQYDPFGVKADISNQISWILERKEVRNKLTPNKNPKIDAIYSNYIRRINSHYRNKSETCYFVLDGIEDIPVEEKYAREEILSVTPFSEENIKVVTSGGLEYLPKHVDSCDVQELPLGKFGINDSSKILGNHFDKEEVQKIHNICNRVPKRIGVARRIVRQIGKKEFFESLSSGSLDELFEVEWKSATQKVEPFLLSVVAFSESPVPAEFASEILKEADSINDVVEAVGFLEKTKDSRLKYTSTEYKTYAKKRLSEMSHEAREWLIGNYMSNPDDPRSLLNLPRQLEAADKTDQLIDFLTPERFFQLVKYGQSIGLASSTADAGAAAARSESLLGPLLRFSLHQSTVLELVGSRVVQAEAEALAALGKYDDALALVDSVLAKEKKLELLSVIAREQSFGPDSIDKEIMLQIRHICESLGEGDRQLNTQKVSTNLIHVDPELALQLIETASGSSEGEYSLDVAYLKLAVAASLHSDGSDDVYREQSLESVRNKMEDPEARKISSATELLLGDYSAEAVIEKAKELEKTEHRMLFLRNWTKSHRQSDEAEKVLRYALKEVRQNTNYGQDMGLLRELVTPLPCIDDQHTVEKLVDVVDRYKKSASELPEEEIKLELLLAESEALYNEEAASDRLTQVWYELDEETTDQATKVEGLARLCASLSTDALQSAAESISQISEVREAAESSLEQGVEDLLKSTAEHFEVTKNAVAALATSNFERALGISGSLNTTQRRDKAFEVIADTIIREGPGNTSISSIFKVINNVESESSKNNIIYNAVSKYSDEEYPEKSKRAVSAISGLISDITNSSTKFRAHMASHAFFDKESINDTEGYSSTSFKKGIDTFENMDNDWRKVSVGFNVVKDLCSSSSSRSVELMEKVSDINETIVFNEESTNNAFVESAKLAIQSYGGLVEQGLDTQDDMRDVTSTIKRLDSKMDRIELFSDLAFEYQKRNRDTEFRSIVDEEIKPLLYSLKDDSLTLYYRAWTYAGPCMYLWETQTSVRELKRVPREYSDVSYINIVESIAYGTLPSEPIFKDKKSIKTVPTPLVDKAIEAVSEIQDSSKFYHGIRAISDIIESDEIYEYDDEYVSFVSEKLKKMSKDKLPSSKFISHSGYLILSKADVLNLKSTYTSVNKKEWTGLVEEARDIENIADRAFVLSQLSDKFPGAKPIDLNRQSEMVEEASNIAEDLPSTYDRVIRLKSIASTAGSVDEDIARSCYKEAVVNVFQESFSLATKSKSKLKKNIISSAYRRIGSDFASSLAKLFDDDEAHQREIQRSIADIEASEDISEGESSRSMSPEVFWRPLSQLNAGLITPPRKDRVQRLLLEGRDHPLGEAYPVYSFSVRGLVRSYADKDQANQILRPVFRAALQNAALVGQLSTQSTSGSTMAEDLNPPDESDSGVSIPPDTRGRALSVLGRWLENNASEKITICDQYFGPEDVEALFMMDASPNIDEIEVLSSIKHFEQEGIEYPKEEFKKEWDKKYEGSIPNFRLVIVGIEETHKSPFHDRYWISGENGIYMGNSFGSIGKDQYSEIISLSKEDVLSKKKKFEKYLQMRKSVHKGDELDYNFWFVR